MPGPLSAAERYRKDAAEFSELAESADTAFMRDYYRRLAQRYLLHAENQEKNARISEGSAAGELDQMAEGTGRQAAAPEETPTLDQPAVPPPLQPSQSPARSPRRGRRRPIR
jgi:hypothetical protein